LMKATAHSSSNDDNLIRTKTIAIVNERRRLQARHNPAIRSQL
jgi:hypothetical protein